MVEAQRADAEVVPASQLGDRHGLVGDRHAAQPVRMPRKRVEHRRIVAAVRAALHQPAAREAERIEHVQILFQRRVRRRVAAVGGHRESAIRRPEHMGMGVAGIRRRRDFRRHRIERCWTGGDHVLRQFLPPGRPAGGAKPVMLRTTGQGTGQGARSREADAPAIRRTRASQGGIAHEKSALRSLAQRSGRSVRLHPDIVRGRRSPRASLSEQADHHHRAVRTGQRHRHDHPRRRASRSASALKQSVVVENRPGANGALAALYVARAAPDGYTLFMSTNSPHSAAPFLMKNISLRSGEGLRARCRGWEATR